MKSTIQELLKSHSDYPTFKSICDTLKELKIDCYPLKYSIEEILELKAPYIVHFKNGGGHIGFVTKVEEKSVTCFESYDVKRKIDTLQYLSNCSGALIILKPSKNSGEKNFSMKWQSEIINNAILPCCFLAFLLFIGHSIIQGLSVDDNSILVVFLTKLLGTTFSLILLLHEFEVHWSVTDKLCHLNKATNCETVLKDKASKFFGWFGWADAGFIYFTGGALFIISNMQVEGLKLLAILSVLSIPLPLFSFFYQGFIIKKWCPMCVGIQMILITEFILLLPQVNHIKISINIISNFILIYIIIILIYILLISFTKERLSNNIMRPKYVEFKKNPNIIRLLLLDQKHYEIPIIESSLVLGNNNAMLKITAFLSLHCSHCGRALNSLRESIQNEEHVLINVVFMPSDDTLLSLFYKYYWQNGAQEFLNMLDKWFNGDQSIRTKNNESSWITDEYNKFREYNFQLFKQCNVVETPTFFINGYRLPHQYDIEDICYLTKVIKSIEEGQLDKSHIIY